MDYRSIIESKYNRQNWQELLYDIFRQRVQFWQQPQPVVVDESMAKKALYTGKINLPDGHVIAIYEVELSDNVVIERNRAGIRNLLCASWRGMGCAGAFMFCFRQNEAVLRFSYVSESFTFAEDGSLKKESTDTRRFTYLLGEGHRSRTAIKQFEELKKSPLDLKAVTKAFSVEALSDLFFAGYKQNYEDIILHITGKRMEKIGGKWEEKLVGTPNQVILDEFNIFPNPEKSIRDYVKKLMGRLVFLQYLEKKGWMGVPLTGNWGDGDRDFLYNLFNNSPYQDSFVDTVLEPLFNDLNTKRDNDLCSSSAVGTDIKIPYLNGGLFERDIEDEANFPLPKKYLINLFDFFSQFNFTIDENDPNDVEVGVDPEMLGRIFENLLEDNKDKGAFYTPKEIVNYMCQECLISYLQTNVKDESDKKSIRQFVITHNAETLSSELTDLVDIKLTNVKICDPAIGSGAFPMGLLKELFQCRSAIEKFNNSAEIKKHIIQNNIYGVDIEKGAVDIARLRFWLSLIVDEETPHALPNMDFKIMQGNSLLEQYKGVDLSDLDYHKTKKDKKNGVMLSLFDEEADIYRKLLTQKKEFYFNCSEHEKKVQLRMEIRDLVQKQLNALEYNIDLSETDILENEQFFLWHTWFGDVFEKGGFDIVIGNPPYIQLQSNGGALGKLYQNCGYETFASTGDIYSLFYEKGWQILKEGGHLCFITSNKWMRAGYGEKTRQFFVSRTNPKILIDFAGLKIFESATVDTNILIFARERNAHKTKCVVTNKESKDCLGYLSDYVQQQSSICNFSNSGSWVILSPIEQSIKRKIEATGTPLKDWDINIYRGVLTGCNEAFIIDTAKRDEILTNCQSDDERERTAELIRPILRGRDIKRYGHDWSNLWLINTHNGVKGQIPRINIEDYPAIKAHLDMFWDKIKKRADKGDTPYNLRNCAYLEDFDKPKIVYPDIAQRLSFSLSTDREFLSNTAYFFHSSDITQLTYLLKILNSKLIDWYYRNLSVQLGEKAVRMFSIYVLKLPIPQGQYDGIIELISEDDIDKYVYTLYGLSTDEIAFIETL